MNPSHKPCQSRWRKGVLSMLLLMFVLPGQSQAIDPNSAEPITIESDSVTFDDSQGFSKYLGNVVIRQGESRLEAEQVTVKVAERQIVSIEAHGKPSHFVETDPQGVETHGYANAIYYETASALLTLQNNARLIQDKHSFSGERIVYDARKKSIHASGNKEEGERVKIQFQPTPTPSPTVKPETNVESTAP